MIIFSLPLTKLCFARPFISLVIQQYLKKIIYIVDTIT